MANYTKYPLEVDDSSSLPVTVDLRTPVIAEVVNRLRDCLLAVEKELGVSPSREYGTVRDRLDALAQAVNQGTVSVYEDGVQVLPSVNSLDFTGNATVSSSGPLQARISVTGAQATQVQDTFTPTNGQTSFTLSQEPIQDIGLQFYVDGVKQVHGVDYTNAGTAVTYTGSPALTAANTVEFWYLVDVGNIVSSSAKIRVYRSSTQTNSAPSTNVTVTWNSTSSLVTGTGAALASLNTEIASSTSGHFMVTGQLSLAVGEDAVSGIVIEILHNGATVVQTISDYGAVWSAGITRSFSWAFPLDLLSSDTLLVRWRHTGSADSTTILQAGDKLSWFAISSL